MECILHHVRTMGQGGQDVPNNGFNFGRLQKPPVLEGLISYTRYDIVHGIA